MKHSRIISRPTRHYRRHRLSAVSHCSVIVGGRGRVGMSGRVSQISSSSALWWVSSEDAHLQHLLSRLVPALSSGPLQWKLHRYLQSSSCCWVFSCVDICLAIITVTVSQHFSINVFFEMFVPIKHQGIIWLDWVTFTFLFCTFHNKINSCTFESIKNF